MWRAWVRPVVVAAVVVGLPMMVPPAVAAHLGSIPESGMLSFTVLVDGSRAGSHTVEFQREGDSLYVLSRINIEVKLAGLIRVYRYAGTRVEVWRGERLTAFEADTEDGSQLTRVRALALPDGLLVESDDGRAVLPANARPATLWNQAALSAPMFDPEDGRLLLVEAQGPAFVAAPAPGFPQPQLFRVGATRYALAYDEGGVWTGLAFTAGNGARIEYLPNPIGR